ncbi:MAG: serine/threonine-protein kinase [Phycisphaerales bacterium]
MDETRYQEVRAVFHEVCELSGDEYESRLSQLCGDDAQLRESVQVLVDTASQSDPKLLDPDTFNRTQPLPEIEGFRIVQLLGEGGMGTVYEAEQLQPARRVALKVLRMGYSSQKMVRRFQREAEVLARLKHNGIAQIYEVSFDDETGVPYIAMELVEGPTLSKYIQDTQPSIAERIQFAISICDAIEHAHQRGVIHRDIKPSNILIDQSGMPKVLDFGIARITESDVRAVTLNTEVGQILGTLAYMSPEQASGDPTQIDLRSDVYSLGVVIFEMLSGSLPHDTAAASLPEAINIIRNQDPSRIGTLNTKLRGDIDTILSKALEREPDRRYQSVAELGADLRRHLANQPIQARPPSVVYQLSKFTKRNKGLVASLSVIFVLLSIGVVSLSYALQRESAARQEAETSLERANAAYLFLEGIFEGLSPKETEGRDTELLLSMLDRAADDARMEIDLPAVRAEMLTIIARTYNSVFEYGEASKLLTESLQIMEIESDPDDGLVFSTKELLATAFHKLGDFEQADSIFRELIEDARVHHPESQLATTLRQYSEFTMDDGRFDEALDAVQEAIELSPEVALIDQGRLMQQQGAVLRRLGRYQEANDSYLKALEYFEESGSDLERSITLNSLAIIARRDHRPEDAERYYLESMAVRESIDARINPDTAATLANLGRLYSGMGQYEKAIVVLENSIDQLTELFGPDHVNVIYPRITLGETLSLVGEFEQSQSSILQARSIAQRVFPEGHPLTVLAATEHGHILRRMGNCAQALDHYMLALDLVNQLGIDELIYAAPIWEGAAECSVSVGDQESERIMLSNLLRVLPKDDEQYAMYRDRYELIRED